MKKNVSNIRIRTQLWLSFGIIIFLITILSSVAWYQARELSSRTIDLYEHPLTVRRALGELKADILQVQRGIRDLCLLKNKDEGIMVLRDIEEQRTSSETQFQKLYDRYLGPKEDIDSAFADYRKWSYQCDHIIGMVNEGRINEALDATRSDGELNRQSMVLLQKVGKISDFSLKKSEKFVKGELILP